MSTVHFAPIKVNRKANGTCPVCGKRVSRSRTFEMTVNPFNRSPDGSVRTSAEVREAVTEEARLWEPDFRHETCKEAES